MELSPILLCLLAAVPVLLLIILLVGCKWSVGRAAVVSVAVDAVIALSAFGAHPLQILVSAAKEFTQHYSHHLSGNPYVQYCPGGWRISCHSCGHSAGNTQ